MGASYIHGCNSKWCAYFSIPLSTLFPQDPENNVYTLARSLGVDTRREFGGYQAGWLSECRWYQSQGNQGSSIAASDVKKAWALTQKVQEALSDKADSIQRNSDADMSVYSFIQKHLPKHLHSRLSMLGQSSRLVFDRLVSTVWGYVSSVENLSVRIMAGEFTSMEEEAAPSSSSAEDTASAPRAARVASLLPRPPKEEVPLDVAAQQPDEDAYVVAGYQFLVNHLAQGLDIRLQKNVSFVSQMESGRGCRVHTRDGEEISADCVIITVPLAVLQGKHGGSAIQFVPPLSGRKQNALKTLAMGCENKVVLRFAQPFWPTDSTPYFQVAGDLGLRFVSLHHYGKPGVLVAHLSPPHSSQIEKMADDEVRDWILCTLKSIFPAAALDSSPCLECVVTRWHQDMFSMGAYSYMPVGSTFEDVHALAQAEGCIFFAGEATSAYDGQCVTGAFDSGAEAAMEALRHLNFCECESCGVWVPLSSPLADPNVYFACEACEKKQLSARYCVCNTLLDDRVYIECERCEAWFHLECVGIQQAADIPDLWVCQSCARRGRRGAAGKGNQRGFH